MKNPARSNRAETMWCKIVPYRNKIKEDCPPPYKTYFACKQMAEPMARIAGPRKGNPVQAFERT